MYTYIENYTLDKNISKVIAFIIVLHFLFKEKNIASAIDQFQILCI